jgi:GT2 family glycosyltransferase
MAIRARASLFGSADISRDTFRHWFSSLRRNRSASARLSSLLQKQGRAEHGALRIAVGIATTGRPAILAATLAHLAAQTRPPDRLLVCPASPADIAGVPPGPAEVVPAPAAGLTAQRNRILDAAAECDLVVFFDDDFLPAPAWLARAEALFLREPAVAAATGAVIADGAQGPGLTPEQAHALLAADHGGAGLRDVTNAYGCNMALRLATLRAHALRFDERLPLYGWFEDVDLTYRLRRHGRVVRDDSMRGVHLGKLHVLFGNAVLHQCAHIEVGRGKE